jgi:hypothetical protein
LPLANACTEDICNTTNQDDTATGGDSTIQTTTLVSANALIIPMDNILFSISKVTNIDTLQNIKGLFNLKAYGLAVTLLNSNIWLQWAIKAGKSFGDNDFTASVQQVRPTTGTVSTLSFKAGPLIIPAQFYSTALSIIDTWNKNSSNSNSQVNVYQLMQDTQIPVLYNIVHKPLVAVLNSGNNYPIQTG